MKSIEELKTDRSTFSIGQAISDGWNLVSKHLGYFIGAGIITVLIGFAAGLIPLVGGLANNLIISPAFMASAIFITWQISRGIPWTDFGDMFKGFGYLTQIMVSSLIQFAVVVFLVVVLFFNLLPDILELINLSQGQDAYENREAIRAIAMGFLTTKTVISLIVFMILMLLITVIWAFRTHFIVIYKMEAWPAMELSRKLSMHNFFQLVGLVIVLWVIIMISAVPCGIGLLFSLPLSIGATYSAFAQITHCDQPDEVQFDFKGEGRA